VATAVVALISAVLGIFKYFDVRSKRQQREAIGAAFKGVVATLSGSDRVERLGSAILLRRFFNPNSEYSKPDMPYADEAIDVIAATLRGEPTGDVQKVLADGLAYVGGRGLRHKDFQRVNLRGGYVSLSGPAGHALAPEADDGADRRLTAAAAKDGEPRARLDVSNADFFEADVSGASFAEDVCHDTVFYRATAVGTVFRGAKLRGANFAAADVRRARFDGADLDGADFGGAKLAGARFAEAENVPRDIAEHLDERGVYQPSEEEALWKRVFVSAPSVPIPAQRNVVGLVCKILQAEEIEPVRVRPEAYRPDRHLSDVKEAMADCAGLVTIGLPQLTVTSATWRRGTADEVSLADDLLHSPWNDIETGIAVGLGLPILSVRAGCGAYGVFGLDSLAEGFEQVDSADAEADGALAEAVRSWVHRALR
jgi:uncharacterized protein YjbI with pentapeptide repeats